MGDESTTKASSSRVDNDTTHREIMLAGAFAAFTVDLLIYPLDTIKTRMQSRDYMKTYADNSATSLSPSQAATALRRAVGPSAYALRGLYQGIGSVIMATLPASLRMLTHAEGGAVRRLLSGYTALAARNLPFTAIQFPLFESLRVQIRKWWSSGEGTSKGNPLVVVGAVNGLSAGTSGSIAAIITTPTDVVKTRMMLGADTDKKMAKENGAGHQSRRPGALRLAQIIYQEHGVRGLFRGGAFRAGWTFIGSGLYLGTYEVAKAWLRGDNGEGDEQGML
ncbi:MAG: hypothetical protein SEPTF4163_003661 [Sporothrix epigloea]